MPSSLSVAGPAVPPSASGCAVSGGRVSLLAGPAPSTSGCAASGGRVSLLAGAAVSELASDNAVSGGSVSLLSTAGPVVPDPDLGGPVASRLGGSDSPGGCDIQGDSVVSPGTAVPSSGGAVTASVRLGG